MKFPNPMTLVDWALRKREPKKSHNDLWRELIANGEELHTRASSIVDTLTVQTMAMKRPRLERLLAPLRSASKLRRGCSDEALIEAIERSALALEEDPKC